MYRTFGLSLATCAVLLSCNSATPSLAWIPNSAALECQTMSDHHLSRLSWNPDGSNLAIGATTDGGGSTVVLRVGWPNRVVTTLAKDAAIDAVSVAAGPGNRVLWTLEGGGSSQVYSGGEGLAPIAVRDVRAAPLMWLNWQGDTIIGANPTTGSAETMDVIAMATGSDRQPPRTLLTANGDTFGSVWASDDGWIVVTGSPTLVINGAAERKLDIRGNYASLDPDRRHLIFVETSTAKLRRVPIDGGRVESVVDRQVWEGVVSSAGVVAYRPAGTVDTLCFGRYEPTSN